MFTEAELRALQDNYASDVPPTYWTTVVGDVRNLLNEIRRLQKYEKDKSKMDDMSLALKVIHKTSINELVTFICELVLREDKS